MPYHITYEDDAKAGWDAYIGTHAEATNYHQHDWFGVVKRAFGHDSYLIAARDGSGAIRGILPLVHMKSRLFGNFVISVPYFNYGGLLCDDSDVETALLEEARKLRMRLDASYVELRHQRMTCEGLPVKTHKITMVLDLEKDEEAQWKKLDTKVRNQARKAVRCELSATIGGIELLDDFYKVFCRNMRDLGTPVYGKHFFRDILETFPATAHVIAVRREGKTIAAGIMLRYRDEIEVPWASSIRDYRQYHPNYHLYWEAIKHAIATGAKRFDFGRSTFGEGTYQFKKQWGTRPLQLYWHYLLPDGAELPQLSTKNPKYRMAIRMWQMMPVTATKIIGPSIVRNIP